MVHDRLKAWLVYIGQGLGGEEGSCWVIVQHSIDLLSCELAACGTGRAVPALEAGLSGHSAPALLPLTVLH